MELRRGKAASVPILTFWAAGVIGWLLRRTLWRRSGAAPQSEGHPRDQLAEARRSHCRDQSSVIQALCWRQSTTRQPSPAQYGSRGANWRSRHGQSVHLGTMVNHRLRPPVRAVNGWRYFHASRAVPSGEHISQNMSKALQHRQVPRPDNLLTASGLDRQRRGICVAS
jgi:hypothetical protein